MVQGRHQTYWKHGGFHGSQSSVFATSLTTVSTTSLTTISARAKGYEYCNSSSTGKRKEKDIIPPTDWTHKQEAKNGRKENSPTEKKLAYEMTDEETNEDVARYVKEQLKPKVPEKRVPVHPEVAAKVASLNNPAKPKNYPRTTIGL